VGGRARRWVGGMGWEGGREGGWHFESARLSLLEPVVGNSQSFLGGHFAETTS
jgi:hypothetical protein